MSRYRMPPWMKAVFWVVFAGLFLAYTLAPVFMGPVEPPLPP